MRHPLLIALIALAVVFAAGCPGPHGETSPQQTSTTTGNPQTNPENSTAMNPVMPPQAKMPSRQSPPAIDVQLTEYTIEMPDTLTAGTQSFTVTNAGTMKHNFAIEGPGVMEKLASDLTRGDSAPMTVNLQKGTYTVYCPVDGHRGKGMTRTITVQ